MYYNYNILVRRKLKDVILNEYVVGYFDYFILICIGLVYTNHIEIVLIFKPTTSYFMT